MSSTLANWFGLKPGQTNDELPEIFPLGILQSDFVENDIHNIYSKIIGDCIERIDGIPDVYLPSLWDNCLESEHSDGLVSMLSKAMVKTADLFLVYDGATKLLRKATQEEAGRIREDYKRESKSSVGTFVSFKNYKKTDMVKIYSALEYCAIYSLNKNMNLSMAIQYKMSDLRGSVSLIDKADVVAQVKAMAEALRKGKDVATDAKDIIETAKPDLTATEKAMDFINERRAFYLGMPSSYVTGNAPAGLGDSGEGDSKAIERGLKSYYFSIVKPVLESVFGITTSFRTEDFRMLDSSIRTLQAFELVSDELISAENKLKIINKLFGFPADTKGGDTDRDPIPDED